MNKRKVNGREGVLTIYGLSLTALLLAASATRLFASATRFAMSSGTGIPAGAGERDEAGVGDALAGVGGADIVAAATPAAAFFIAASLAVISARF